MLSFQNLLAYICDSQEKSNNRIKQLATQIFIHPGVVKGKKAKWEWGMTQGEGGLRSVLAQGWQMLERVEKNRWSFPTLKCLKSMLVSGRFCLTCT